MWKWGSTTGLKALSVLYLLSASAFGFALALQAQQPWAVGARDIAKASGPFVITTTKTITDTAIRPAMVWAGRATADLIANLAPKPEVKAPVKLAANPEPKKTPAIAPVPSAPVAPPVVASQPPAAAGPAPQMQLAETDTDKLPLVPAPDATPPSPAEVGRVLSHLKVSLSKELYDNFSLFLYVSKADHGPWHQRMFVFAKEASGNLRLAYSFPVSTGREMPMPNPDGSEKWNTNTPQGYFQLDKERVYRRYRSQQWGHAMPYAMFFSWEREGIQTGVAIHAAVDGDIADLGKRASAGCVRLHPQNAHLLFNLIKQNYRGSTPLFAYDRRTATMSKEGLLMHDKAGNIQYAEGYKVLVLIENNGGDDLVAALF